MAAAILALNTPYIREKQPQADSAQGLSRTQEVRWTTPTRRGIKKELDPEIDADDTD